MYKNCEGRGERVDQNIQENTLSGPKRLMRSWKFPIVVVTAIFAFDSYSFPFLILLFFHRIETSESETDFKGVRLKCSLLPSF